MEKKQKKARKRKRLEQAEKRLPKLEIKSELAEIFLIKAEGEAKEEKRDHLSTEIVPKLEIKRELGESFLIRSVDDNDEFVEEEKENITPISSADNSAKENNSVVRNYSRETFNDRRVVAKSFFDNF